MIIPPGAGSSPAVSSFKEHSDPGTHMEHDPIQCNTKHPNTIWSPEEKTKHCLSQLYKQPMFHQ